MVLRYADGLRVVSERLVRVRGEIQIHPQEAAIVGGDEEVVTARDGG